MTNDDPITYMANVHTVIQCEDDTCGFVAADYLTAKKEAEKHHRETGHELIGEQGLAIWVGETGREYLEERTNIILSQLGLTQS